MSRSVIHIVAAALIALSGCNSDSVPKLRQGGAVMNEIAKHMRTVCVGRLLVDIPEESLVNDSWETLTALGTIYVKARNVTKEEFERRMALRETELANSTNLGRVPLLVSAVTPEGDPLARVIAHRETGSYSKTLADDMSVGVTAYRLIGSNLFELTMEVNAELNQNKRGRFFPFQASKLEAAQQKVYGALARIRARKNSEIPAEPGYCIDSGFIPDAKMVGRTGMSFRLKEYPGFWFFMGEEATGTYDNASPGPVRSDDLLPKRMKNVDGVMGFVKLTLSIKQLVPLGPKQIGPFAGQTMLWRNSMPEGARSIYGEWEYPGKNGTFDHPYIQLKFDDASVNPETRKRHPKEMAQEDVTALWFRILESIKQRPNSF